MTNREVITQKINSIKESVSGITLESIKDVIYASTEEQVAQRNKYIAIAITVIISIMAVVWAYRRIRNVKNQKTTDFRSDNDIGIVEKAIEDIIKINNFFRIIANRQKMYAAKNAAMQAEYTKQQEELARLAKIAQEEQEKQARQEE
ncbi:hypothetical protein NEIRO03_0530 [Nematocida sp. AWRm78]|nr:hypothetical protein NEIRO02_1809 [Nematocida sp. AWRm79]KAI5182890.1 hypothetical protein NEIRO03_0530 [Nematocida sp. AWRm78]